MHILILASFYPSKIRPHTGVFFETQANALHRQGHQVGVIVLPRLREMLHNWRHNLPIVPEITREESRFPVYRMHYIWFPRIFPEICAQLVRIFGLRAYRQYIAEYGTPDVIHAHNIFYGGVLGAHIKHKYDIPVVNTEHSSNHISGRFFLPAQKRIISRTLASVDRGIAVSQFLADVLRQSHPDIEVVGNVINTDFFHLAPLPDQSPFIFASVGSLVQVKNFPLLIRAFTQAYKGQNSYLNIGGDGPEREAIESVIIECDMSEQIRLLGRLNSQQVRELFQQSHVIVSSSHIETFGVTLIEAMASGRPVIATRSGGPEGFVIPENGLLVDTDSVDALAEAMLKIKDTFDAFDSTAIRAYCVSQFSEAAIVNRLLNHYRSIIDVT